MQTFFRRNITIISANQPASTPGRHLARFHAFQQKLRAQDSFQPVGNMQKTSNKSRKFNNSELRKKLKLPNRLQRMYNSKQRHKGTE